MTYPIGTRCDIRETGIQHCAVILDFARKNGVQVDRLERASTQSVYATLSVNGKVIAVRISDHSPYGRSWRTCIKRGELKYNTRGSIALRDALARAIAA